MICELTKNDPYAKIKTQLDISHISLQIGCGRLYAAAVNRLALWKKAKPDFKVRHLVLFCFAVGFCCGQCGFQAQKVILFLCLAALVFMWG